MHQLIVLALYRHTECQMDPKDRLDLHSRILSEAEKKYSQIEKEGLACVFGVKKFHSYMYGRHFSLVTDHKPLLTLFNERRAIPPQASARIQRWALTLSAYEYILACKSTTEHSNADGLSRLPLDESPQITPQPAELVPSLQCLDDTPVTSKQIKHWTSRDPVLSQMLTLMQQGWPDVCPHEQLKPFWNRKTELSSLDGCISLKFTSGDTKVLSATSTTRVAWCTPWHIKNESSCLLISVVARNRQPD